MLTLVLFEHHLITEVAAPGSFTAANVAVADDLPPPMPLHHHLELPHARGFPFCHFPVARSPSFILVAAASPLARAPVSICVSLSLSLLTWIDTSSPHQHTWRNRADRTPRQQNHRTKQPEGARCPVLQLRGVKGPRFFFRGLGVCTSILEGVKWTSS